VLGNGCATPAPLTARLWKSRVLTGLRERMMTPTIAAEAMRTYT
jgi:hypothetical protein